MKVVKYDNIELKIFESRSTMGTYAAKEAATYIQSLLETKAEINCIFAAAPSQNDFLSALIADSRIEWNRINAYHMDEYIGLKQNSEKSFSGFLTRSVFSRVPFKSVNLINGENENELERYTTLLNDNPVDIVFMGIGENGHIAFNDPSVADFNDPKIFKIVELEESCRVQQVNDGCFTSIDKVPQLAYTITIPGLMRSDQVFCIVPTKLKAEAVRNTLVGEISEKCPASILRNKKNAKMYIDSAAASLLEI